MTIQPSRLPLQFDALIAGVSGDNSRPDSIVYDLTPQPGQMPGSSATGRGHAAC